MTVVKVKNKAEIDKLQATLTLKLGRKISQQETLELCVKLGKKNVERLIQLASSQPMLTPEIAEQIIQDFEQFSGSHYDVNAKFASDIDNDAYL